jgi:flagellar export protein FliJ
MNAPSFRFRLERIRDLRERHEGEAKQELAGAMSRRARCEQQLDVIARMVEQARESQMPSGSFLSGTDLVARQAYLERVEAAKRSTERDLHRHDQDVAGRRDALTEAARDRQVLERLKANRLAEYQRETARSEGAALDEIATNAFRRRAA